MPTLKELQRDYGMKSIGSYKRTGAKTSAVIKALARYHGDRVLVSNREHFERNTGRRHDAYGILDLDAITPNSPIIRGIQACYLGKDWRDHVDKFRHERLRECEIWLSSPYRTLELWGWKERKARRKDGSYSNNYEWVVEVQDITLGFLRGDEPPTMIDVLADKESVAA